MEHGVKRQARLFIGPEIFCPACMRRYPTRSQAVEHLSKSKKCSSYQLYCGMVEPEVVEQLDRQEGVRIKDLAAFPGSEGCRVRHLDNMPGPLMKVYVRCYKNRPIYKPARIEDG